MAGKKAIPPIIGFFEDIDLEKLADDVHSLKTADTPAAQKATQERLFHIVTEAEGPPIDRAEGLPAPEAGSLPIKGTDRQTGREAYSVTPERADGQADTGAEGLPIDEADGQTGTGAEGLPIDRADGQTGKSQVVPTKTHPAPKQKKVSSNQQYGVTESQNHLLQWLIYNTNSESIITYPLISQSLKITYKSARTHLKALCDKGLITVVHVRSGQRKDIVGQRIIINDHAHIAVALFKARADQEFPNIPSVLSTGSGADGMPNKRADGVPHVRAEGLPIHGAVGQTYCSSSILKTTTEQNLENQENSLLWDGLILDEWDDWGLRPHLLTSFVDKGIPVIQDILDKTAYIINQKAGTQFEIKNRIGFLRKCLAQEFCEVDNNYVSRAEKIKIKRIEQLKLEAKRIKQLKIQEQNAAIDVVKAGLSKDELEEIKRTTVQQIRDELKNQSFEPAEAMIESYMNNNLLRKARELKIL